VRQRLDTFARTWAIATVVGWVMFAAFVFGTVSNAQAAETKATDLPAPTLEQRRDTPQTSVDDVSATVMCPSCDTTLDQSDSPAAQRMRVWVTAAVEAGWTQEEIRDGLVDEYGGDESILATPRAKGAGLLVWLVPALVALAALLTGLLSLRRWRRDAAAAQTCSVSSPGSQASGSTSAHSASRSSSPPPPSPSSPSAM
jgi:cytochrome c-type biogenesis protein CcmH/NrfF